MNNVSKYIDSKIGLIKIFNESGLNEIEEVEITLANHTLKPNDETTLNEFFNEPVVYLGLHDGYMQFKVGQEENLFDSNTYTSEFKKISENRIMNIYQVGTARDYNFKNGIWK